MMHAFRKDDNEAAEPLLRSKSSSSDDAERPEPARGSMKALLSPLAAPLSAALACQPAVVGGPASTCTDAAPAPSPRATARRDILAQEQEHPLYGSVARGVVLPGSPERTGRKDPAYRHHGSPTSVALDGRSSAGLSGLPASLSSPSLLSGLFKHRSHPVSVDDDDHDENVDDDDDLPLQKSQSDEGPARARSYDGDAYRRELERAYEELGFEVLRKTKNESLKQPRLSFGRQKDRGRAGSCPDMLAIRECRSGESSHFRTEYAVATQRRAGHREPRQMGMEAPRTPPPERRGVCVDDASIARSAPTDRELGERSRRRMDAERLLSQMGMDVTEEDYCLEGEFGSRRGQRQGESRHHSAPSKQTVPGDAGGAAGERARCHSSYDCNYNTPLEDAYEDFGVERKLVVLNPQEKKGKKQARGGGSGPSARSPMVQRLVRSIPGNVSSGANDSPRSSSGKRSNATHHKAPAHNRNNDTVLKSKVLSILRRKKDRVPTHIDAVITPTTSEDNVEVETDGPLTPEDLRLLHRWQDARMRSGASPGGPASAMGGRKGVEDVLSIASSCGDKTAPMDNKSRRSRRIRQGYSF